MSRLPAVAGPIVGSPGRHWPAPAGTGGHLRTPAGASGQLVQRSLSFSEDRCASDQLRFFPMQWDWTLPTIRFLLICVIKLLFLLSDFCLLCNHPAKCNEWLILTIV